MDTETCQTCFAEVKSDNMRWHADWHSDLFMSAEDIQNI